MGPCARVPNLTVSAKVNPHFPNNTNFELTNLAADDPIFFTHPARVTCASYKFRRWVSGGVGNLYGGSKKKSGDFLWLIPFYISILRVYEYLDIKFPYKFVVHSFGFFAILFHSGSGSLETFWISRYIVDLSTHWTTSYSRFIEQHATLDSLNNILHGTTFWMEQHSWFFIWQRGHSAAL